MFYGYSPSLVFSAIFSIWVTYGFDSVGCFSLDSVFCFLSVCACTFLLFFDWEADIMCQAFKTKVNSFFSFFFPETCYKSSAVPLARRVQLCLFCCGSSPPPPGGFHWLQFSRRSLVLRAKTGWPLGASHVCSPSALGLLLCLFLRSSLSPHSCSHPRVIVRAC